MDAAASRLGGGGQMPFPDLRILVTGGTIDKVHDWALEALVLDPGIGSAVPGLLGAGRCDYPVVQGVLFKDSLDMDDADRARIADAVRAAPEARVVITHGTGTVGVTARYLDGLHLGKTVVLTGAMRPATVQGSDAAFNLGAAVAAAQVLGTGVWGAMNGRVIPASALEKNTATGRFDD
jgi:L-asparaginase